MGAGDFGAGEGPAGEDPVEDAPEPRDTTPFRAVFFDGATRSFPYDDAGRLQDIHPIDQKVALLVLTELGKLGAAPDVGSTIKSVPIRELPQMRADYERRIRRALKTMLDNQDIAIDSVSVTLRVRWRPSLVFRYVNLRLVESEVRTITG